MLADRTAHYELPKLTVVRICSRAREAAFTPEAVASPLAKRPYDLRHAAVSTWLNGGVPPTDVAEWAGQSVEILFRIYAKCLDRGIQQNRQRVQTLSATSDHGQTWPVYLPWTADHGRIQPYQPDISPKIQALIRAAQKPHLSRRELI